MNSKIFHTFISLFFLISSQKPVYSATNCLQEQPLCATVNLTTLLNVCRDFFRVPCPQSCGVCASEKFKLKFLSSIDPNSDHIIGIEEAQIFFKSLNISIEDALVTEIKDLFLDSKAVMTDLYNLFDSDGNNLVNLTELIKGYLSMFDFMGVKIKPEFKESISHVTEMIKISNNGEVLLPKLNDLIKLVSTYLNTYPHGLLTLNRIQNMTKGFYNLERLVTAQQLGYSINTKLLTSSLLAKMDRESDGSVSQLDFVYFILGLLKCVNVTISQKAEDNLKTYFDIYHASLKTIKTKYGINEISLLEGKVLSDFNNKAFVNLEIPIKESVQSVKKYQTSEVMRYIRSATNGIPQRKLTVLSIIESAFGVADRNKDGLIDIPEFVYFAVTNLPKEVGLIDMNEALKVMKLYDENNDDKLSSRELKELLKPESETANSSGPSIFSLIK